MATLKRRDNKGKSLRGVVLVMVITVMCVLIVMLLATLSVVSTAKNRTYEKFEENQAYYSARSALDVFKEKMLTDKKYIAQDATGARTYSYTDSSGVVQTAPMKQGRAIELEFYKIRSKEGADYVAGGGSYPFWLDPRISDGIFTTSSPEEAYYTVDDSGAGGSFVDKIEYKVTLPNVGPTSGNNYGKIVDTDSAGDQIANIRVEVISRVLDMSPAYTTAQIQAATATSTPSTTDIKNAIKAGNRAKDKMTVKITSTVTYMGVEGVAVLQCDVTQTATPDTDNAINSLGTITGSGAGLVAAGGASSLDSGTVTIDASGTAGSIFSLGTLNWGSSGSSTFDAGASVYARGGIIFTNSQNITAAGDDSYMYVEGAFDIQSSFVMGDATHLMNVVSKDFKYINGGPQIYGNIYTDKFTVSSGSDFGTTGKKTKVYVKDLYLTTGGNRAMEQSVSAAAPGAPSKKLVLKGIGDADYTYYGQLYLDGSPISSDDYASIDVEGGATLSKAAAGTTMDLFPTSPTMETIDESIVKKITLPADLASGNTDIINIKTVQSVFGNYFPADAFGADGELKLTTGTDPYATANIEANIMSSEREFYRLFPPADAATDSNGDLIIPATSACTLNKYSNTISGGTVTSSGSGVLGTSSGTLTVDTSAGDVFIQLQPGVEYSNNITVTGDNSLYFLMPEQAASVDYKFGNNFKVTTTDVTAAGGQAIDNGTTKAPKIHYFAGKNANVSCSQNAAFFTGYFYMPLSKMTNNSGNNGISKVYTYNGTSTTKNYFLVGSVICGNYSSGGSSSGVCYLSPDSGAAPHGDPNFNWSAYQYSRK